MRKSHPETFFRRATSVLLILALVLPMVPFQVAQALTTLPTTIGYEGQLTDVSNEPIDDTFVMIVSLYDDDNSDGTADDLRYTETFAAVTTVNGYFQLQIGTDTTPDFIDIDDNGTNDGGNTLVDLAFEVPYMVELTVDGTTLTPMADINTVTYSVVSRRTYGIDNGAAAPVIVGTEEAGDIYYDTTGAGSGLYIYDGALWQQIGGAAADITSVGDVASGAAFDGTAGNVLQFEGTTADINEISLAGADATTDQTITLPDATGVVLLSPGLAGTANSFVGIANGFSFEGTTPDGFDTSITVADPTANNAVIIPDASGTLVLDTTLADTAFVQNGNSFGATATLGTNDNFDLNIETNGTTRATLQNDGDLAVDTNTLFVDAANNMIGVGTTTPAFKLELAGTATTADRKIGINGVQAVYIPDQAGTAFDGSLFIGNGGASLSHVAGADGQYNTGVGIRSLLSLTTGFDNTAVGTESMRSTTTGTNNSSLGYQSLYSNDTGFENVALGVSSLFTNTSGERNVAVGANTLLLNSTGDENVAIGYEALNIATGSFNVAVGRDAGADLTTGVNNTFLGYGAGLGINTGNSNTIIGSNIFGLAGGLSGNIIIGDGNGNQRINVDSSGNVGFGDTTPDAKLDVELAENTEAIRISDTTNTDSVGFFTGNENPNGTVSATNGSLYIRNDAGNQAVYINTNGGTAWTDISSVSGNAFINGGNSFGAAAVLGTNDNNTLSFETNGATAATFSTAGELDMLNNFIENIGDAGTDFTASGGLTLAGTLTANGQVVLGDGGDTIAFNSSDWDINATGDMTGIGAITADGNITQTGATTFSTGTGAISMNGATSVTGTNTFTVGTGTTTLGGTLAANGQVTLGDNGDTVTIDSSDWNVSATGDMTGIGSIAADGGYTQTGAGQNTFSGNVDATSGLDVTGANLTVGGANFSVSQANGNITSAGDLAVNGGDISTTGTALVMTVGNTGAFTFSDGTNTLCTMTDAGTTGDLTCSGSATFVNQTLSGDLAVNGGDITSTSPLTIDGTGTLTLADNVTQSGAGTFTTGTGLFTASGDATVTGTTTMNGNTVIGDAAADMLTINSSILGGTALTFEGTTADAFETFFAFTDPTADNTITFPDQSGDVLLGGNDSVDWDDIADAMTLDASTTSSMGANTLSFNLDGAGDFLIQDNGATFVTFADDGSTTFANDIAVNGGDITSSSATLTIDAGSTIAFADDLSWTTATPTLAIANGEVMTITDGTNTLFTLTDAGTTGNLAISGDTTVNGNTTLGNATTDTTTINGATTISSGGNTPLSLTRTSSGQFIGATDGTDTFGVYNRAGSPEGNITADAGSLAIDTTSGALYVKTDDGDNTDWQVFTTSANAWVLGGNSIAADQVLGSTSNFDVQLQRNGTNYLVLNNTAIDVSEDFVPTADNALDLGIATTNRFRTGYFGTSVVVGATTTITDGAITQSTSGLGDLTLSTTGGTSGDITLSSFADLFLDSTTTGTVALGDGNSAKTISIANGTAANTVNIATENTVADTITVGSSLDTTSINGTIGLNGATTVSNGNSFTANGQVTLGDNGDTVAINSSDWDITTTGDMTGIGSFTNDGNLTFGDANTDTITFNAVAASSLDMNANTILNIGNAGTDFSAAGGLTLADDLTITGNDIIFGNAETISNATDGVLAFTSPSSTFSGDITVTGNDLTFGASDYVFSMDTAGVGTMVFNEAGDDTDFRIESDAMENLFFIDASANRIGINTNTPFSELNIVTETQNNEIVLDAYGGLKNVFGGRSAGGTYALPTPTLTGDILAEFSGLGYGDTAFAPSTTGGMRVVASEDFADNVYGTDLIFRTTGSGTPTLATRMTIDADGNVGVGDATPAGLLTVGNGDLFQVSSTGAITTTSDLTVNGNTSLGNNLNADTLTITSAIQNVAGSNVLVFEGSTSDTIETIFAITDPTASDKTITFPNASGTVALLAIDDFDFDDFEDTMDLDASTEINFGANNYTYDLNSTGDFLIQDNGATFVTFADDGSTTFGGLLTANGTLALGDGGDTVAINSSDWDISTTGDMTGIGAITADGNISQTGATTLSTGTGAISLNGATSVTGANTLTVGTGTTTLGGTLAANGAFTLGDNGDTGAIDTSDWDISVTGDMTGIGNITSDGNTTLGNATTDTTTINGATAISSGANTPLSLTRTSAGQWLGATDGTDTFGVYNRAGSPEGNITADAGSLAIDTTSGALYVKTDDGDNTDWQVFTTSANAWVLGGNSIAADQVLGSTSNFDVQLQRNGTNYLVLNNTAIDVSEDFVPTADNALDLGIATTNRFRTGYFGTSVVVGATTTITDGAITQSTSGLGDLTLSTTGGTSGDITLSSFADLFLDSTTTGTVALGDGNSAKTISIANGTAANTVNIATENTVADTITVGSSLDTTSINGTIGLNGATTVSNGNSFTANGQVTLGDNGDTVAINSSDWDITTTGDMTGIGAITTDGNFSQTGATTFSTGTGAVSMNGATSVTGTNTFTVGTGTTTLGGLLNVTGNTTLTGDLAVNGGDITSTSTTLNLVVGNTGTTAFTDGTNTLCSIIDNGTTGNFNCTGNASIDGDVTLGNAAGDVLTFTGTIAGATPFTFEGATADTFETSFAFVDPTADQTITFPDATGTVILDSTLDDTAFINGGNSFGAAAVLGTNDNNTLSFETNGATAATFSTAGELDMLNNFIENIGDAGTDFTAGGGLTLAGTLTANGTVILGDGGDTIAFNSSDWDINATGDMTGIGAITADGNITQTGATTFSTGTGAISMNGATSVTGTNTFTVGTGTTTLGGTLAANGQVTLGDNGDTVTIDSSDWNVSATGDMTGIGSIAADGGYTQTGAGQNTFSGNVDATSGLDVTGANLTVGGANFSVSQANGNITSAGDLAVNGGDISTTGTALVMTVGNTGAFTFSDGTNTLCTMTDAGTTGDLTCSGSATFVNQTLSGDLAVNGGDITSTSPLTIDGTGTLTLADNVTQSGAGTFTTGTGLFTASGDATVTGTTTMNGNTVIGDAAADMLTINSSILGGTALTFEGTTADAFETFFAFTDPTADNTITFPDQSGDVLLGGNDSVDWDDIADAMTLDASTTSSMGANTLSFNLDGAGDFLIQDNGATFVTFADDGSTTFANDIAVNGGDITSSSATLTIDAGSTIAFADDLSWTTATPTLAIANGEVMTITDGTNTLFTLTDAGTTGNLAISGDTTVNGNTTLGNATTDTTTINGATTISSGGNTPLSLTRTSSGQFIGATDGTDTFGVYNRAGSPEGNITADAGSLAIDTTSGALYVKTDDGDNTDWQVFTTSANAWVLGGNSIAADQVLGSTSNFDVQLQRNGTNYLVLNNTAIDVSEDFVPIADNALDLGIATTNRFRTGYFGTSVVVGATTTITDGAITQSTSGLGDLTLSTTGGTSGDITLSSFADLFLDSTTTGTVALGDGNSAKTISIANGTAANTVNIATENTVADTITVGSSLDTTSINGTIGLNGATTVSNGNSFTANGQVTLGDNGDTVAINSADWDITTTGDMTGIGAITADGNISQTGATTFSTGTGAVSMNGATSVTGTNTFTVGTGTTTLGGLLNVTGNTTLTGDLAVNGGDITSTSTTLNLVVGNTGTTAFTDGTNTLCSIIDNGTTGNFNCTGNASIDGDVTLGNAAGDVLTFTGTIAGATPFTFEGATADTFETSFAFVDPTADQTITFPDATGTVILDSTLDDTAFINGGNSFGAAAVLGTNDNNTLSFETNGATAATFSTAGELDMLNNFIENIGDAGTDFTAGGGLTLAGTLTANGTVILGDGGDTIAFNSSDWDINATGDMTGIGAITADGNFSQTGATTFSTGTGAISMNGATSVTGTNTFTVGTGTTTLGGTLAANGQVTLGDNGDTVTIDSSDWNVSATGDMTGIGSIAADGGYTQTGAGQNTFSGNVDATSGLDVTGANLTVGGANFSVSQANGNITSAGDLAVNGGDISTTGTALVMTVGNTGAFTFSDGTNTLCTMTDAGTTGDLTCSGSATFVNQTLSGDLAVNGGDITSTSPLTIDGTGTLTLADNVTQSGAGTFTTGTGLFTASGDATVTGTTTMNGNTVIGDAAADTLTINSSILGGTALTFEGTTTDAFETFFAFTDPTADNTITFPDQSGDVLLGGNDSINWDDIADAMTLDASTTSSMGANTLSFNLDGAGDFLIQDNGATFVTFADDGSTTFANDIAVNGGDITSSSATLTIDAGSTIAFADDLSWTTATPTLAIANGEVMTITDGTNTLFTLTDAGTTGNLAISGDTTVNGNTTLGNATTDTTTINGATTISSGGNTPLSLTRTSSGQFIGATDGTDTFGVYNRAGSPEGNITADAGSLAIDTTSGALYVKTDDGDNTDWQVFTTSANAWVLGGNSIAADQVLGSTSNFDVQLQRNGTNYLVLNNTAIDVSEDFVPTADNALDLGIATTNRFRTGYFGTSVVVGATTTITDGAITQSTSGLGDLTLSTTGGTSGDITLSSFADLFLDSTTTGTVALGDGNSAKTISIANGTAANTVNIATENTVADTITVGSSLDTTSINGTIGLNGATTVSNGNSFTANGQVTLGDNGDTVAINSADWDITTTGDMTGIGSFTNDGNLTFGDTNADTITFNAVAASSLDMNANTILNIGNNGTDFSAAGGLTLADDLTITGNDIIFGNAETISNATDGVLAFTSPSSTFSGDVTVTGNDLTFGANDYMFSMDTAGVGTMVFNEAGDDTDFRIESDLMENLFFIDASANRIGINTNTPFSELNIVTETQNNEIVLDAYGGLKNVFGGRSAGGTYALPTPTLTGDILAEFSGLGYGDTAFAPSTTGGMRVVASEDFADNVYGTDLIFRTTGSGTPTLATRMTIDADGNVGVGDATPAGLLTVGNGDLFQVSSTGAITTTSDLTVNGNTSLGNNLNADTLTITSAIQNVAGSNVLVFEGATSDTIETIFAITDPTASDKTITFPNASGTVALLAIDDFDFDDFEDTMDLDAATEINFGANNYTYDLNSTGDFLIQDNGATFVTFADDGSTTFGGLLTANGTLALGDGGDTITINSSDWDITSGGDMTGIGAITADGNFSQTGATTLSTGTGAISLNGATSVTGANTLTVGTGTTTLGGTLAANGAFTLGDNGDTGTIDTSDWDISVTGDMTGIGNITSDGNTTLGNATTDTTTINGATTISSGGNTPLSLTRTSSGQFIGATDGTDTFGVYNRAGSPEGNITADAGSLAIDTTSGALYVKTDDGDNTDWQVFTTSANAWVLGGNSIAADQVLGSTSNFDVQLQRNGTNYLVLNNTAIDVSEDFVPTADNALDLGIATTNRFRTGYFGTSVVVGATTTITDGAITQSTSGLGDLTLSTTGGTSGDITLSSFADLFLDSTTTGTVALGDGNSAKTISIANGTAANTVNIATENTVADTITVGSALDSLAITGANFSLATNGNITTAGDVAVNGGDITSSAATLVLNAGGTVDIQDNLTADALTLDTGDLVFENGESITNNTDGTVAVTDGTNNLLTIVDAGTVGNVTATGSFTANGAGDFDTTLNIDGALTANGTFTLGDNGDTGIINTSDWDIGATGDMTGIGALTMDGNFSQTGATTFSTGTGAISLNGATSVTGTNTFSVGTGTTTLGGLLNVTGNTTLTGDLAVNGDDITSDGATLTINAAGTVDVQDILNADSLTLDTGGITLSNGETFTNGTNGSFTFATNAAGTPDTLTLTPNTAGGATFSGIFTTADLTADRTYTYPDISGTIGIIDSDLFDFDDFEDTLDLDATTEINLGTNAFIFDLDSTGDFTIADNGIAFVTFNDSGATTFTNDIALNGGDLTTTSGTATLFNTGATTLNIGGAATTIGLGAAGATVTGGGALTINSAAATALTIDSGTTGALNLGTSNNAKTINIGTGTAGNTVNIANNGTTADAINMGGQTTDSLTVTGAVAINTNVNANVSINSGTSTGTVNIGAGTSAQTLNFGTANGVKAINIGTGNAGNTISIGTGTTTANTIAIGGTAANTITLGNTQTAGSISLGAAMTGGTISIGGTGLQTGAITIGAGTGAQTINLATGGTGVKTINLGTGNAGNTINIGTNNTVADTIGIGSALDSLTISGFVQGASPFIFEGGTADAAELTLSIATLTGDQIITLPDATGTVIVTGTNQTLADNTSLAFLLAESTNQYFRVNTTDAAEAVTFGNGTTNPSFTFAGSGTSTFVGDIAVNGDDITSDGATLTINAGGTVDIQDSVIADQLRIESPNGVAATNCGVLYTDVDGDVKQDTTEFCYLEGSSKLGLGGSPDFQLHIFNEDAQNVAALQVANTSGTSGNKNVFGGKQSRGTIAAPAASVANDILLEVGGSGYGDTSFAPSTTAGIRMIAESTFTDANHNSQLIFLVTGSGAITQTRTLVMAGNGQLQARDGSAALPTFTFQGDTDTGMFWNSGNNLGFSTGGTERLTIDSNGNSLFSASGTAANPSMSFIGDNDTGIFRSAANELALSTAGTQRAVIDANGDFGIGETAPSSRLSVVGTAAEALGDVARFSNLNTAFGNTNTVLELRTGANATAACTAGGGNTNCSRYIQFFEAATTDNNGTAAGRIAQLGATGVSYATGAADFGEYMLLDAASSTGDIVGFGGGVKRVAQAGDVLLGVVSESTGFLGNGNLEGTPNANVVGFLGIVSTTVNDENGAISEGDPITVSSTNGEGMKQTESGYTVGYALDSLPSGTGAIDIFVAPKYTDVAVLAGGGGGTGTSGWFDRTGTIITTKEAGDALTIDGTTTLNGNVVLGSDGSDTLTFNGSLASGLDLGNNLLTNIGNGGTDFTSGGGLTLAADLTITGNDLAFGNGETISNTTDGTISFTDGTNTLLSIIDAGTYGTLKLSDKGSTGDPATCTAGEIYFNDTDNQVKACVSTNTWVSLTDASGIAADSLNYTDFSDTLSLDATTTTTLGANNNIFNLDSTGDFIIQDNGVASVTFADDGSTTVAGLLTANGAVALGDNGDSVSVNSNDWDISATGDMTGIGSIALNGNFTQTGATTFGTGTGAVSLNGATSITGSNTFTVGTGTTALGGLLNVTGNQTNTGDVAVNGGDLTTTSGTATLFNTGATTLNIGGAATTIGLGAAGATVTGGGALTINSGAGTALTVDSGTLGALNLGTGNNAKTINVGTGNAGNTVNIGTNNTVADTIAVGSALDSLALTSANWSATAAGNITLAGDIAVNGADITSTAATLRINAAGTLDVQDILNADSLTLDTGDVTLRNTETIANSTDDLIIFGGAGGANNVSLTLDLDGASASVPTFSSSANDLVAINDSLTIGIDGATTENIALSDFAFAGGNDLYVEDKLGVNGNVSIDGELIATTISGAGLTDCDSATSILLWDSTTKTFSCGVDNDRTQLSEWSRVNLAAGQTNLQLDRPNSQILSSTVSEMEVPFAGEIVYMSVGGSNARTNGSATFTVFLNGATTGFTCVIDGTNTQYHNCSNSGDTFVAGDVIDVRVTTTGTWSPTNAEWDVVVYAQVSTGADLAELYNIEDSAIEVGDVVSVLDTLSAGIKKSDVAYDDTVMGVISTKPGHVLGIEDVYDLGMSRAVALSGRVPVKVSTINGDIEPGDYLTTSTIPGVAMKATRGGAIIGTALSEFSSSDANEIGIVTVFIKNGYANGSEYEGSTIPPALNEPLELTDLDLDGIAGLVATDPIEGDIVGWARGVFTAINDTLADIADNIDSLFNRVDTLEQTVEEQDALIQDLKSRLDAIDGGVTPVTDDETTDDSDESGTGDDTGDTGGGTGDAEGDTGVGGEGTDTGDTGADTGEGDGTSGDTGGENTGDTGGDTGSDDSGSESGDTGGESGDAGGDTGGESSGDTGSGAGGDTGGTL